MTSSAPSDFESNLNFLRSVTRTIRALDSSIHFGSPSRWDKTPLTIDCRAQCIVVVPDTLPDWAGALGVTDGTWARGASSGTDVYSGTTRYGWALTSYRAHECRECGHGRHEATA